LVVSPDQHTTVQYGGTALRQHKSSHKQSKSYIMLYKNHLALVKPCAHYCTIREGNTCQHIEVQALVLKSFCAGSHLRMAAK